MGRFSVRCSGLSPESLLNYLKEGVNRTLIQFSDDLKLERVATDVTGGKKVKSNQVFLSLKGKKIPSRFVPRQDNFSQDISLAGQSDLLCLTS